MSISGPQALAALDEALRDLRREEDDILRKLMRGLERLAKLRDTETELLRQLAGLQLAADPAAALTGAVARTTSTLRAVLETRGREMAAAGQRRRQIETALAERRAERAAALADVDHLQQALRALGPRIGSAITRTGDYEQQRLEAAAQAAIAAAAWARSRQAGIDREARGRPFRDDPLFGYLWDRNFGTADYKANALTRLLDSWLASLIRFEAARSDYILLEGLPGRLTAEAEAQAARAAIAQDRLDAIEESAIEAVGGGDLLVSMKAVKARLLELDAELSRLEVERAALVATQTGLLAIDDAAFGHAVAALLKALGSSDLAALVTALRAHPDVDDAFATQLDDVRLRFAEEQADARDLRARLATLAERRLALEGLEHELKARQLDDPRALFHDAGLVGPRLDSFLVGETDAKIYLEQWLDARAWSAGVGEWGGGIGLPHHGRGLAEGSRRQPAARRPAAADLPS